MKLILRLGKGVGDADEVTDAEDGDEADDHEDVVHETMFTFEAFEMVGTLQTCW
jgi:replication fork protection complex subunit Tof1/Swi1